jgi:hypothetical protein
LRPCGTPNRRGHHSWSGTRIDAVRSDSRTNLGVDRRPSAATPCEAGRRQGLLNAADSGLAQVAQNPGYHSHAQGSGPKPRLRQGHVPRAKRYRAPDRLAKGEPTDCDPLREAGDPLPWNADPRDDAALSLLRSSGTRHIFESIATTETRQSFPRTIGSASASSSSLIASRAAAHSRAEPRAIAK